MLGFVLNMVKLPLKMMDYSGREAAAEIGKARMDRGLPIYGETCPQVLFSRCIAVVLPLYC